MTRNDNRLFKTALGVALALAGIVSFVTVSSAGPKSDSVSGINATLTQMRSDLQSCNSRGLSMSYTPDAQMMGPGLLISGRDAIEKHMAIVCNIVKDFRIDGQEFIDGGDTTVDTGVITFTNGLGGTVAVDRYMTLWKKSDGKWLIFRDISVPVGGGSHAEIPVSSDAFKIKTSEAATAVVLPGQGGFDQVAPSVARLKEYLEKSGIKTVGAPFGRFFNAPNDVPTKDLRWEVGFLVPAGTSKVDSPFTVREFPSGTIADAMIPGCRDN